MAKKHARSLKPALGAAAEAAQLRTMIRSLAADRPALAAAATAVVFKCNNPLCIVGIKISGVPPISFVGQHAIGLPSGTKTLGWKVTSNPAGQAFTVTVSGATLDLPIKSVTGANAGGVRQLTV